MLISYSYDMFWLQTDVISSSFWWNPSNEIPNWEFKPVYCNNWNFTASPLLFVIFVSHHTVVISPSELTFTRRHGVRDTHQMQHMSWQERYSNKLSFAWNWCEQNMPNIFFRQTKWFVIHWLLIKHNVILWN